MSKIKQNYFNLLQANQSVFEFSQEFGLHGIWVARIDKVIKGVWINPAFKNVIGDANVEEDKIPLSKLLTSDSYEMLKTTISKHQNTSRSQFECEIKYHSDQDDKPIAMVCQCLLIDDPNQNQRFLIGANTAMSHLQKDDDSESEKIEATLRNVTSSVRDIVFTLDRKQRHTGVYGKWIEDTGMTEEHFIGKRFDQIIDVDNPKLHEEANQRALDGEYVVYEWDIKTDQGTLYFETSLSPIIGEDGTVEGLVGIGRNITERHNLKEQIIENEQKIRESEKRYRSIIEVSNTGAWEYDHVKQELWCSPEYFTMIGYDPSDFDLSKTNGFAVWADLIHPDDREVASKKFADYLAGEMNEPYENYFRLIHKDGSSVWIWSRGQNIKNDDGSPSHLVLGTHIDITDIKTAEIKIRESEEYLRSLFKTIPDLLFVISKDGEYLDVKADDDSLYIAPDEFIGKTAYDILPDEIAQQQQNAIEKTFKDGDVAEFDYSLKVNGEINYYNARLVAFGDDKVVAIVTNTSKSVENFNRISGLLQIREDQNKRLRNFTHIVSHNLRSHTANLLGLLDVLDMEEPEVYQNQFVQLMKVSADQLNQTITHLNQVLDINLNKEQSWSIVNLKETVKNNISSVSLLAANAGLQIHNEVPEESEVEVIPAYLDSIILNMLTNAIKFKSDDRDSYLKITLRHEEYYQVLEFADNGLGIDLEKHGDKLFGMYKTFHGHEDSKGLGLFMTKSQVDAMGGKIEVKSEVDKGTTFSIYLSNIKITD